MKMQDPDWHYRLKRAMEMYEGRQWDGESMLKWWLRYKDLVPENHIHLQVGSGDLGEGVGWGARSEMLMDRVALEELSEPGVYSLGDLLFELYEHEQEGRDG